MMYQLMWQSLNQHPTSCCFFIALHAVYFLQRSFYNKVWGCNPPHPPPPNTHTHTKLSHVHTTLTHIYTMNIRITVVPTSEHSDQGLPVFIWRLNWFMLLSSSVYVHCCPPTQTKNKHVYTHIIYSYYCAFSPILDIFCFDVAPSLYRQEELLGNILPP